MSEVMKKTHRDSYFVKIQLNSRYSREPVVNSDEIALQTIILNEKEVIVEIIKKDKYI